MERAEERTLVDQLRSRDPNAFDRVYEAHHMRLYRFLLRLSRRREIAEDLLQETWMRAARAAVRLDPETRLLPWLLTIARNVHLSHQRWLLLDLDRWNELRRWRAGAIDEQTPFELAAAGQLERKLEAALGSLPVRDREVILLVVVEQLEPSEAAVVLGLRPEAMRQRLARARARLGEMLGVSEGAAR